MVRSVASGGKFYRLEPDKESTVEAAIVVLVVEVALVVVVVVVVLVAVVSMFKTS